MLKKTNSCILPKKYIRNKSILLAFAAMLLILTMQIKAFPANQEARGTATQPVTITGTVTDQDNSPMPGVYVVIAGTNTGVVTGANGKYSIQVPDQNASLTFTFVGFLSETTPIEGRSVIDISLMADIQALEEVVVIGYGTQRKEAVTGSVASVKGDVVREVAAVNIQQSLQGRMPGVEMTQTSTKPGAGMQVRIRGTRSLTASNDPLVVLDGIPFGGSINDIDPNSVKSIDILKDASATAIYGSRGANGVILITTNRGTKGQKATITYSGYYGVKTLFARYPMMDGPEFAKLRSEVSRTVAELGRGVEYPNSSDESDDVNTDWQDMFYRRGMITNHDISLAQGSEKGNYTFAVGYFNDQAVIPTQGYSRITLRTAVDQEVGKFLRFGLTSNNSYGVNKGNQVGVGGVLASSPLADPYDADGNLKRAIFSSQDPYRIWTKETVEDAKDVWLSESKAFGSYNNLYGEVKVPWVEGLKYRMNLGINYRTVRGGSFTGIGVTNATNPDEVSSASTSTSQTLGWAIENLLTYDHTFAGKHQVNAVGLYSAEQSSYNSFSISAQDLPADHLQYYNLGYARGEITINPDNQNYSVSGLMSWMGRVMYAYDSRYMLSATYRADASSRLAEGHKWHSYPAVSLGWNIANESFMKSITQINTLKLRVGYGETSNQAVDAYKTLGRLSTRFYNFGAGEDGYSTGYYISELPNEELGWEYTETWNFGLDFGLFAGRLTGTVEYYRQHTKDILLSVDLPSTAGVSSYVDNIGETENNGLELSLNGIIINNPNGFSWEAGINVYGNRNKLIALTSGQEKNEGNSWFVGQPINVIYDYEKIGLWQEEDPYLDILEPGGNVGMIKVKYSGEYNEDGTPVRPIGSDDRQVIKVDPDFQGGFNTRLAYKNIDLSILGSFRSGGILISSLHSSSSYLNLLSGRHGNIDVDYWTPENTGAKYPRPGGITSGDNPKYGSTLGLFDASYLKIRNITLGYNFSQNLLKIAGISQLRLYVTVQNALVMFSPYHKESGLDPEPNSYGNENQAVTTTYQSRLPIVAYNTPVTRNYLIGINITF